jgi:drug/metabolite transporter (DMT)-like permease
MQFRLVRLRWRVMAASVNYRLGSIYSVATALLFAVQEPFSFLAARHLNALQFVCLTQIALLTSLPILLARATSRSDFAALLRDPSSVWKLAGILGVGLSGLLLYNLSLSRAHPIIISAILNLSPFWAALVARVISKKRIPISRSIFFGCLAGGFVGAMAIPWSQMDGAGAPPLGELASSVIHGGWIYAIPIPVFTALSGTLIGIWFSKYDESAAIAANFLVSTGIFIPTTILLLYGRSELSFGNPLAVVLMIVGTIIAASLGRVFYQIALTVTDNDNGYVTMFFLLVPALTSLVSLALSWWIRDLHFVVDPLFFFGLFLNGASLLIFSLKSWLWPGGPEAGPIKVLYTAAADRSGEFRAKGADAEASARFGEPTNSGRST